MICPRCGNEWDATKSPCTRCGLAIRLSNYPGAPARTSPAAQTAPSRTLPPGPAQPNLSQSGPLSTTSPSGPSWSVRGSTANSNSAGPSTLPNTPRPFQFTAVPMPHSPAPTVPTSTPDDIGIDSNLMKKAVPRVEPMFGQVAAQPLSASPDPLTSKNVPHRPTIGGPEQAHLSGLLTPE